MNARFSEVAASCVVFVVIGCGEDTAQRLVDGGNTGHGGAIRDGTAPATGGLMKSGDSGGTGGNTGRAGGTSGSSGGRTPDSGSGGGNAAGGTGGRHSDSGADVGVSDGGVAPSCSGLATTCGPASNDECCSSPIVAGGTFYRSYDGTPIFPSKAFPATLSNFRLDRYEITVGRFRKFVAAYSQNMIVAGAGKNTNNPSDPGWDATWNASLPSDAAALAAALKCNAGHQTWTDSPGANENKPINCINWFEAFAFCTWDGGRLPTAAESNYAAAGGNEQRVYPWSSPASSTSIDCSYANYYVESGPGPVGYCVLPGTSPVTAGATNDVGSESPKGDGKYGQADLAGNVWEWTLDWDASNPMNPCKDCAQIIEPPPTSPVAPPTHYRVTRGGGFNAFGYSPPQYSLLLSSTYYPNVWTVRDYAGGSRCARSP